MIDGALRIPARLRILFINEDGWLILFFELLPQGLYFLVIMLPFFVKHLLELLQLFEVILSFTIEILFQVFINHCHIIVLVNTVDNFLNLCLEIVDVLDILFLFILAFLHNIISRSQISLILFDCLFQKPDFLSDVIDDLILTLYFLF